MKEENKSKNNMDVHDLRTALSLLKQYPEHLISTDVEVDANGELAAVYRHIGAGTPVEPPTRIGPAMLFNKVKDHQLPVITGVMASRERCALMLGTTKEKLAFKLLDALNNLIEPTMIEGAAPCQEIVHKAPLDIRKLLPAPTNTAQDAGPYFNMGLIRAEDPETGESDVTIHRLCVQGPDLLSVFFVPGRHIDQFRIKAEKMGKALPISINMGLDPAVYIGACFEPPTTPLGFDELQIGGALRGKPVELVDCLTVDAKAIAHAEIVIEGEIIPGERIREDINTNTGYAMPEFPGYMGEAVEELPMIRVKAVTYRKNAILQTIIGPGEEHTNLAGIPTEASILNAVEKAMPGRVKNIYAHSAGGGKYLVVMQFEKLTENDEGRQRQAALVAFSAFSELKHIIIVDPDVDIFNTDDVLWAMTTRYQGDRSTVFIPGVRCHPLDPSQSQEFNPLLLAAGTSCKTIFDCTVPFHLQEKFKRAHFDDVDISRWINK